MSGHHLVVSGEGAPYLRCDEPPTAPCHVVYDCDSEELWHTGITTDGNPYHLPGEGDLHVGRFVPGWCNIEEWCSWVGAEDSLSGEYAIPLRVEWGDDGPILHLPKPTKEDR